MVKVSKGDYIDPTYKKLSQKPSGQKLLRILRLVALNVMTVKEIQKTTNYSMSEVKKLLRRAEEKNYVKAFIRKGPFKLGSGRPPQDKIASLDEMQRKIKKTGRPEAYYSITGDGRWLMALDPEIRDKLSEAEKNYLDIPRITLFDSYPSLKRRIISDSVLKQFSRYDKDILFRGYSFLLPLLGPFLFVPDYESEEAVNCYGLLVKAINESVKSEHISYYYRAVEASFVQLQKAIHRHQLLLDEMEKLPEVKEYLDEKSKSTAT